MLKNVLSEVGGVGIYGVISISLFFLVFIGLLIWVCGMKQSFTERMSVLPLNDGEKKSDRKGAPHE